MNQFTASLWGDEAFSAILSMKSLPQIIEIIKRDTSPPLYNFTEYLAFSVFGTNEVVIRGLSFFYYLVALMFSFLLARHFFDKKTTIWATLLTFLNPFFFIYAFEGRMYSIMAAGVAASMYFFIKKRWFWYIIATGWALYSHHFAIFILFVQGTWFLYQLFVKKNKKDALSMFKAFLGVALIYSPWLIPLYNQTKMVGGGFWLGRPDLGDFGNVVKDYLAEGINHKFSTVALYLVSAGLIFRNWLTNKEKSLYLFLWFILPITLAWIISQKFQPIFYNRYLLYTIPGAMILLASNRRAFISNIILSLVVVMFFTIDLHYFFNPTKLPFRDLAQYVQEHKRDGDYLINYDPGQHKLWESKYYNIPAPIYIPNGEQLPYFVGTALMEKSDIINEIPKETKRIGVITQRNVTDVKIPNYLVEESKEFKDIKFVWLKRIK